MSPVGDAAIMVASSGRMGFSDVRRRRWRVLRDHAKPAVLDVVSAERHQIAALSIADEVIE